MSISIHSVAVPLFKQLLGSLSAVLDKGAALAEAKKIDPAVLMQQRLVADMLPLVRQVQIASDSAKGCMARLAGVEMPSWPDEEKTIDEAKARIAKTLAYIDSIKPEQIDGAESREIVFTVGPAANRVEMRFHGLDYVMRWVIPNFTFHCTTAYDILRANGVDIGKRDFLGAVQ